MSKSLDILIPRRLDDRKQRYKRIIYQKIKQYIKNVYKGDLDLKGYPLQYLPDDLIFVNGHMWLNNSDIISLNNLAKVTGTLFLNDTQIKSIGKLKYIGKSLNLINTPIESLGNLKYVGTNIWLYNTPLAKTYTEYEIRKMVDVRGIVYFN